LILFLLLKNIKIEAIKHIANAVMISELSFCKTPTSKPPTNITKKKIYANVSKGADFLMVAKAKIKPSAN